VDLERRSRGVKRNLTRREFYVAVDMRPNRFQTFAAGIRPVIAGLG
jgi:hypothetical protein